MSTLSCSGCVSKLLYRPTYWCPMTPPPQTLHSQTKQIIIPINFWSVAFGSKSFLDTQVFLFCFHNFLWWQIPTTAIQNISVNKSCEGARRHLGMHALGFSDIQVLWQVAITLSFFPLHKMQPFKTTNFCGGENFANLILLSKWVALCAFSHVDIFF